MGEREFQKLKDELGKKLEGKENPNTGKPYSEKEIDDIARAQFKKDNGRNPKEAYSGKRIDYDIKISEAVSSDEGVMKIKGTAINVTTTRNGHTFTAEELKKAAPSLKGRPLLKDHFGSVDSIAGKVTKAFFSDEEQAVLFEADVTNPDMIALIERGELTTVSVGALVKSIEEVEGKDEIILRGIEFVELSLVAIPADKNATFAAANLEEGFAIAVMCALGKEQKKVDNSKKLEEIRMDEDLKKLEQENAVLEAENAKVQEELAVFKKAEEDAKAKEEFDKKLEEEVAKRLEEKEKSDLVKELCEGEDEVEKKEEELKGKTLEELQKVKEEKAKKIEDKTKGTLPNGESTEETFEGLVYEEQGSKVAISANGYDTEKYPVLGR